MCNWNSADKHSAKPAGSLSVSFCIFFALPLTTLLSGCHASVVCITASTRLVGYSPPFPALQQPPPPPPFERMDGRRANGHWPTGYTRHDTLSHVAALRDPLLGSKSIIRTIRNRRRMGDATSG